MAQSAPYCTCADPTPVQGEITHAWFCFECGNDLTPLAVQVLALKPVRATA